MPPAAIYARISRDRAGAGLGVDRQEADCRALATRLHLTVGGLYVDNDMSAFTGKKRAQYERLLTDVQAGQIGAILAWHPDRLHRSPKELERFIDVVEQARIDVHTCTAGDVDLTTASGRMVARIVGAVARHESEHKSERIRRKHLELAEKGMPNGGLRRFGYEIDGMTVSEPEAELVREMCQRIVDGGSVNGIYRDLVARGVPTVQGGNWTPSLVRQIVLRPRNAGLRLRKGEVFGEAAWPAIVPVDLWEAACKIIKDPSRRTAVSNVRTHLMSNLATCGTCGRKLRAKGYKSTGHKCYACPAGHVVRRVDFIDPMVEEVVFGRLSGPDAQERLRPRTVGRDRSGEAALLRARMKDAAKLFARGAIDAGTLEEIREDIDAQLGDIAAETVLKAPSPASALVGSPGEVRGRWEALPLEWKRAVIADLMTVAVHPAAVKGRGFDPSTIEIVLR